MKRVKSLSWLREEIRTAKDTFGELKIVWFEEDLSWFITDQNTYPPSDGGYPVGLSIRTILKGWENTENKTLTGLNSFIVFVVTDTIQEYRRVQNEID